MVIPKILHFIWIPGFDKAPEYAFENMKKWSELNPDYKIKIWEEDEVLERINPRRVDVYRSIDTPIRRSDFARLEIIIKEGGIYLDCDLEPYNALSRFFKKKKLESPKEYDTDKKLKFVKKKVDISSKQLIFSREWKNPDVRETGIFSRLRNRIANGVIMSVPENQILDDFLEENFRSHKKKVLHYLGPHALTVHMARRCRMFHPDQLCIIPPQHFLWERSIGKMPRWSISKHMGQNTWGDHSKPDYWNV